MMKKKAMFPIRFKILVAVLFLVSLAVSLITFTMAKLFHSDKTAYIHDLTSVLALHTAKEAQTILEGYKQRTEVFSRVMLNEEIPQTVKSRLLKNLFEDFEEFIAVTLYADGKEKAQIFDAKQLRDAGIFHEDFKRYRKDQPLPFKEIATEKIYIENSSFSEKLPMLTLAIVPDIEKNDDSILVSASVRLDRLLQLARRSSVFDIFLMDDDGNILTHSDLKKVFLRSKLEDLPFLGNFKGKEALGITKEYAQNDIEWVGGFSHVGFGNLLAGVQIPKTTAYLSARDLLKTLTGISLGLLLASGVFGLFWSKRITKPIEGLSKATQDVGKGDFKVHVKKISRDEIGHLAESFNHMTDELKSREEALKEAQTALVHSEKMAAFGQLGAGIAHEVKNPLAGILGYTQLSMQKLEKDTPFYKNLQTIEKEAKRCKSIIENLMKFARPDKVELRPTNLNLVVKDAMAIVNHQMNLNQIKLEKYLDPKLPPVTADANQIEQVLINLLINAQQAMEGNPGTIRVSTRYNSEGEVVICLRDSGPGIPNEIKDKIFEPFFSTKATGKGTGLGLSVSYGIMKDHRGEIKVESKPGKGTTFILTFPKKKP